MTRGGTQTRDIGKVKVNSYPQKATQFTKSFPVEKLGGELVLMPVVYASIGDA
jgi:hypothetical protein